MHRDFRQRVTRLALAVFVIAVVAAVALSRRTQLARIVRYGDGSASQTVAGGASRPRVALVIDDFGYVDSAIVSGFLTLPIPLTAAVLPYEPQSRYSADEAHRHEKEVILHLPMQGREGSDPGPDALIPSLSEKELRERTRKAIDDLPFIVGANNHMGSLLTADPMRMRWVLEELKAKGLYFVDSRTAVTTVAESLAREMHIPTTRRRIFLDDTKSYSAIEAEWNRALRIAQREGSVLVIGHVYPETLAALRVLVPRDGALVQFVKASELVR